LPCRRNGRNETDPFRPENRQRAAGGGWGSTLSVEFLSLRTADLGRTSFIREQPHPGWPNLTEISRPRNTVNVVDRRTRQAAGTAVLFPARPGPGRGAGLRSRGRACRIGAQLRHWQVQSPSSRHVTPIEQLGQAGQTVRPSAVDEESVIRRGRQSRAPSVNRSGARGLPRDPSGRHHVEVSRDRILGRL
jgi:hypothetical protein